MTAQTSNDSCIKVLKVRHRLFTNKVLGTLFNWVIIDNFEVTVQLPDKSIRKVRLFVYEEKNVYKINFFYYLSNLLHGLPQFPDGDNERYDAFWEAHIDWVGVRLAMKEFEGLEASV